MLQVYAVIILCVQTSILRRSKWIPSSYSVYCMGCVGGLWTELMFCKHCSIFIHTTATKTSTTGHYWYQTYVCSLWPILLLCFKIILLSAPWRWWHNTLETCSSYVKDCRYSAVNPCQTLAYLYTQKKSVNTLNTCILPNTLQYCTTTCTPLYSSKKSNLE